MGRFGCWLQRRQTHLSSGNAECPAAAAARGLKTTELAREWIIQRLSESEAHDPAVDAVAGQLERLAAQLRAVLKRGTLAGLYTGPACPRVPRNRWELAENMVEPTSMLISRRLPRPDP